MKFGLGYFATAEALPPGELARLVEERGHESLFFPEHTHIPAARHTAYPGGGELPPKYARTYDLFVACTAAAAATSRLRIGSGICLVTQRDPITTAKEVASVDRISGGRFEFGVGAGWNREELVHHGTDPRQRMAVMAERIEAMKAIWTEDEASYQGEFVSFEPIWSWPKPAQRPHPPVLIGGGGPTVIDRVLRLGDAWFPLYGESERFQAQLEDLRARAERPIEVQVIGVPAKAAKLEELAALGVSRVIRWLPTGCRTVVEPALERWEAAIAELYGEA